MTAKGWKNKNGTSERNCSCGSWKQHWINFSENSWPMLCSVKGCINEATLGAHVINVKDHREFIIPMCDSCNKKSEEFELEEGTILVSANKSKTCEKY